MYNRYIPQADGSYRRNRILEPVSYPERPACPPQLIPPEREENPIQNCNNCQLNQPCRRPMTKSASVQKQPDSAGSFLRQLLPKEFSTEDLIVVLLLLLMAGDCQEDQNTALLTLVLYLFL